MNKHIKLDFTDANLYIGIDAHKKNWQVVIRCNGIQLKRFNMDPSPTHLANYLKKNYPNAHYKAVYEAGFCGFWIQRQLYSLGVGICP